MKKKLLQQLPFLNPLSLFFFLEPSETSLNPLNKGEVAHILFSTPFSLLNVWIYRTEAPTAELSLIVWN